MIRSNWVLGPGKFLTREEVDRLLGTAGKRAKAVLARGNKVAVRDYLSRQEMKGLDYCWSKLLHYNHLKRLRP